ncbi:transcription elongation regulator 1-like protein isoform X2 [Ictidomys tridecemlineatus]
MRAGARLPRRRQLQQPQQPRRRPPLLWPMNADPPPPWVWMVPGAAGLLRLGPGVAPPPLLIAAAQPAAAPLLPGLPGWPAPGEPLLPLLPLPSAPDHAAVHHYPLLHGQWLIGGHSPPTGLSPSSTVELVPIFPHVCPSALPARVGRSWIDKRMPNCKIFVNNSFALDSTWIHPGDSGLLHLLEKPPVLDQVALTLSRPIAASRPRPAVVLGPQPMPDRSKELSRAPCPPALMLHSAESKSPAGVEEDKEPPSMLESGEDSTPKGNRPVASTPVPGSPWCVVWTGDDRVFFFNPTMQLSVWEKPVDLKDRGDLKRIIEDPPHKRKLEASATDSSDGSSSEDGREYQSVKTKRNRTEGCGSPGPEEPQPEDRGTRTPPPQILLPLEERATHFRDMLLERGVSAFSTWEKELHKIVFDPRYLLLNSEERKQIFEQFVKTRIKEEYKEKKSKLLLAKEEFRKLLEESKVSPRWGETEHKSSPSRNAHLEESAAWVSCGPAAVRRPHLRSLLRSMVGIRGFDLFRKERIRSISSTNLY